MTAIVACSQLILTLNNSYTFNNSSFNYTLIINGNPYTPTPSLMITDSPTNQHASSYLGVATVISHSDTYNGSTISSVITGNPSAVVGSFTLTNLFDSGLTLTGNITSTAGIINFSTSGIISQGQYEYTILSYLLLSGYSYTPFSNAPIILTLSNPSSFPGVSLSFQYNLQNVSSQSNVPSAIIGQITSGLLLDIPGTNSFAFNGTASASLLTSPPTSGTVGSVDLTFNTNVSNGGIGYPLNVNTGKLLFDAFLPAPEPESDFAVVRINADTHNTLNFGEISIGSSPARTLAIQEGEGTLHGVQIAPGETTINLLFGAGSYSSSGTVVVDIVSAIGVLIGSTTLPLVVSPDGSAIASGTILILCLHGSSLITTRKGRRRLDQIQSGDYVATGQKDKSGISIYAKVLSLVPCWTTHPGPPHDAVIIEPNALGHRQPTHRLIIDPGHRILYKKKIIPAGSLVNTLPGISIRKWTDPEIPKSLRYDLVLAPPHKTYLANGVVVASRESIHQAGYHHSYQHLI